MDKLSLTKLAKKIENEIISSGKAKIDIEEYCKKKLKDTYKNLSNLQIADILNNCVEKVERYFRKKIEDSKFRGVPPEYEFIVYPPHVLYRHNQLDGENRFSFRRKYRKKILKLIQEMKWRDFEFLCKHLLEINKITPAGVTSKVKEGGVDFYGLLQMDRFSTGVLLKDVKIRIIGQAKRYSNVVGEEKVRNFWTHYKEFSSGEGRAIKKLPKWFTQPQAPVLGFLITTSKFSRDAKEYAKKRDIILRDGEQVVEDLIKSPRAEEWFSYKEGKQVFDETLFMKFFGKED